MIEIEIVNYPQSELECIETIGLPNKRNNMLPNPTKAVYGTEIFFSVVDEEKLRNNGR